MRRTALRLVLLGTLAAPLLAAAPAAAQRGPCWQPDGSWNQQACPWQPGQRPGMGQGMMGQGMMGPGGQGMMGQGMGPGMMQGQGGCGGMMQGQGMGPGMMGGGMMGQGGGMMGPGMMGRGMMGGGGMARLDTDRDGAVSADEAAAMAEWGFDLRDEDGDDRLSREEFVQMEAVAQGPGGGARRGQAMQARREARFKVMDANGDGAVDHGEFMAWHETRYKAADLDGDGKVSVWEFRAVMRRR